MNIYDAYISGYYGMNNSGDDALLNATVWGAKKFLLADKVAITSPKKIAMNGIGNLSATLKTTQQFKGQNRLINYKNALLSRQIIFGGGSVIHNSHDINLKLDMMKLSRGRHLALGISIGPFRDSQAESACRKFLNRCHFVGLRDNESFEIARDIAPNSNIQKTFDLAPLLLMNESFKLKRVPRRGIAINLCSENDQPGLTKGDHYRIEKIAKLIKLVHQNLKEPIYLFNMNGDLKVGDNALHKKLQSLLPQDIEVKIINYDSNPFRLLQRLASFKAVVSTRLHGNIFGFLSETPTISINYHKKCDAWCDEIKLPAPHRVNKNHIDPYRLLYTLEEILLNNTHKPNITPIQTAFMSLKNWRFADAITEVENFSRYSAI